jgi:hypothetical protein
MALTVGSIAGGQEKSSEPPPTSPIMDLVDRAKNSLNNLQYTQARTAAREILAISRLKRTQEIAALEVAAAAYFPDDTSARMPDSATFYLHRLVRMLPTGSLPPDLVSPALDSQLAISRRTTFGASARAPIQLTLKGTESRAAIEVMSTRPARWQLYLISGDGGPAVLLDTLSSTTSGRFSLRAHDGKNAFIQPGDHQFKILGISDSEPDTITMRFDGTATGAVPTLVSMPTPLDVSKQLPERAKRAIGAGIAAGLISGGATWALANALRPPDALGREPKDGRATGLAIGISIGAITAGFLDHGKPLPENIKANADARKDYLSRVGDATETNRKRVAEYSVALTIDPEIK